VWCYVLSQYRDYDDDSVYHDGDVVPEMMKIKWLSLQDDNMKFKWYDYDDDDECHYNWLLLLYL
jgi:hypothetical protein